VILTPVALIVNELPFPSDLLQYNLIVPSLFKPTLLLVPPLSPTTEKIEESKLLFQYLILNMFVMVISVPFDAAINAHEDMMVYSIISIFE
jgi:hypothetical protein